MHICANCGHEFEGKFCPECGTRFVDKDACPKCGAKHAPEAKFCPECGARLDGKIVCPKCGAEAKPDAAFCEECGTQLEGIEKSKSKAGKGFAAVMRDKVKPALYLSGIICVLISALIGLVFAFVSGVTMESNDVTVETNMLYYYFGDAYKDANELKDQLLSSFNWKSMGEAREFALYFPAVLGSVISAVGLLGVVALSGLTCYKAYKKFCKKEDANVVAPAIGVFLVFATLATLLLSLNAAEALETETRLSTPTIVGLAVGGAFCGLGVLLVAVSNYDKFKGFNGIADGIVAVAVTALIAVVLGLLALPSGGAEGRVFVQGSSNTASGFMKVESEVALFPALQAMLLTVREDETIFKAVAYCTVGGAAAIALAVIAAVILFRKVSALGKGKNSNNLILCGVSLALAVLYLVFTILYVDLQYKDAASSLEKEYGPPIAVLVLTAVAFFIELAGKIIIKKFAAVPVEEAPVEETV